MYGGEKYSSAAALIVTSVKRLEGLRGRVPAREVGLRGPVGCGRRTVGTGRRISWQRHLPQVVPAGMERRVVEVLAGCAEEGVEQRDMGARIERPDVALLVGVARVGPRHVDAGLLQLGDARLHLRLVVLAGLRAVRGA